MRSLAYALIALAGAVAWGNHSPPDDSAELWAVGTVEILCEGPYTLRMRGGFPWNGSYRPIGDPYAGDYGAVISVTGMAEWRDDPPFTQPSPVAYTIMALEPSFTSDLCDVDEDGDVDLYDVGVCHRFMTGPGSPGEDG